MKRFLVMYATRHGQAKKVAEFVGALLREHDHQIALHDAAHAPARLGLTGYDAVVLVASVHIGSHEREMTSFVKQNRASLQQRTTALISVSLAQASVESTSLPPDKRAAAAREAETAIARFCVRTGFRADRIMPVAGALAYSKYGPVVRFMMRRIAKSADKNHDGTHDHEYTDWSRLRTFVADFISIVDARPSASAHPGNAPSHP